MSKKKHSLVDRKSTGGDHAQQGFGCQDDFVIGHIPKWIADSGFMQLKQEGLADVEITFFMPGRGEMIDIAQVKNSQLAPAGFKDILSNFYELSVQGSFRDFYIVARSVSSQLQPLVSAQIRLINHYDDYVDNDIGRQSIEDFRARMEKLDIDPVRAEFLLDRVTIVVMGQGDGDGWFHSAIDQFLPEFENVPRRVLTDGLAKLRRLIQTQKNRVIKREEIEDCLYSEDAAPSWRPVHISFGVEKRSGYVPLSLDWTEYFDFQVQKYPSVEQWQGILLPQLTDIANWMLAERSVKRICVPKHAISTAIAVGLTFKAVAGFKIDIEHNDEIWSSDDWPDNFVPKYELEVFNNIAEDADELVVAIGINRDIFSNVESHVEQLNLGEVSKCYLFGSDPILSAKQANYLTNSIKREIVNALNLGGTKCIHLFYAGPVHLATFIGHRLNATTTIQCYEWHNKQQRYFPAWRV